MSQPDMTAPSLDALELVNYTYNHCSRPEGGSICCHCRRSVTCVLVNHIQYISALMLEIFVLKNDDICLVIGSEVLQLSKKNKTSALFQIIWHVVGTGVVRGSGLWCGNLFQLTPACCYFIHMWGGMCWNIKSSAFCYWGIYITHNYQCCQNL